MITEEMKMDRYESYVGEMIYEWGDYAKCMTYEEFCQEQEDEGWPDLI